MAVAVSDIKVIHSGLLDYQTAWQLQRKIHEGVANNTEANTLMLVEHPSVFTAGRRTDLLERPTDGTPVVDVDRGGRITWHGPGQIVGYPIVNVENSLGASGHVCDIQRLVVGALRELGLDDVGCLDEYPGVWVGVEAGTPRKISAIGVRLSRGRTMHGFALNVHPDMAYMREHIVPCGIEIGRAHV